MARLVHPVPLAFWSALRAREGWLQNARRSVLVLPDGALIVERPTASKWGFAHGFLFDMYLWYLPVARVLDAAPGAWPPARGIPACLRGHQRLAELHPDRRLCFGGDPHRDALWLVSEVVERRVRDGLDLEARVRAKVELEIAGEETTDPWLRHWEVFTPVLVAALGDLELGRRWVDAMVRRFPLSGPFRGPRNLDPARRHTAGSNADLLGEVRDGIRAVGWPEDWLPRLETSKEGRARRKAAATVGLDDLHADDRGIVMMLAELADVEGARALAALLEALGTVGTSRGWSPSVQEGRIRVVAPDGDELPGALDELLDDAFEAATATLAAAVAVD